MRTTRSWLACRGFGISLLTVALLWGASACSDDDVTKPDGGKKDAGADLAPKVDGPRADGPAQPDGPQTDGLGQDAAGSDGAGNDGSAAGTTLGAALGGLQEVPAVTTTAKGTATVTINAAEDAIDVDLSYTDLHNISAAHIHLGATGENGGVLFPLASASFASPFKKTLTATDLSAVGSVQTFADAVAALKAGKAYFNIHTTANPGGELRGQIGAVELRSTLGGGQEVPAVTTTATGSAIVKLDGAQEKVAVELTFSGLTGITAAHIHLGAAGSNGGVVLALASAAFTSPLNVTLSAADLTATGSVQTFDDLRRALLAGQTYINIHTSTNAGGELRGQIGRVQLSATLEGGQEVPPVTTTASGAATVQLNGLQDALALKLEYTSLTGITAAHIHGAAAGANGGVLVPLASATFASPLEKTIVAADVSSGTFSEFVAKLLGAGTYINVHTSTNPGGELRGQIKP